jgi:hypothetical protein
MGLSLIAVNEDTFVFAGCGMVRSAQCFGTGARYKVGDICMVGSSVGVDAETNGGVSTFDFVGDIAFREKGVKVETNRDDGVNSSIGRDAFAGLHMMQVVGHLEVCS